MGSAKFETVMDYARHEADAAIRCAGCGHTSHMSTAELGEALGWGTRLARARERLKCSQCGHRGAKITPVPHLD